MNLIAINTSQNVNINFTLAGIGERFVAFLIDSIVKIAFLATIFYLFIRVLNIDQFAESWDSWTVYAFIILISSPVIFYTLMLESLMEGQTFGKKIMKIKVVKIDGYQASFIDYLMRWVFRLVDIWSNFGAVGLITVIASQHHQRLGGIASGTAVISLKSKVNISHTILEELKQDYIPIFPQVVLLSDNDMRIIKENYQRAISARDGSIISKLSIKIKQTIKLDKTIDYTDSQFINTVIKDYNYYTGKDI